MSAPDGYGGAAEALTDLLLAWVREVESDHLSELSDRRATPRLPLDLDVRIFARDGAGGLRLHDLSQGGLRGTVTGSSLPSSGERVEIEVPATGGGRFRVPARVVRVGAEVAPTGNVALEFVDVPTADVQRLAELVAALTAQAHEAG
jgi:hypothetical protein